MNNWAYLAAPFNRNWAWWVQYETTGSVTVWFDA